MRLTRVVPALVLVSLLSACGGGGVKDVGTVGSDGGDKNATSGSKGGTPTAEVIDFGLAQSSYTTEAIVLATTNSEAAIGEFATVTVNFLDAGGKILATESQVESFNWVGQQLVFPVTPTDLDDNVKVASIEPSISFSDYGMAEPSKPPMPVLDATEIKKGEFSDYTVAFGFTNDTDADLKDLRIGVVCYDPAKKIIGGTSTYPDVAPAGKTIRIEADPTVSEKPASCKGFVNYPAL